MNPEIIAKKNHEPIRITIEYIDKNFTQELCLDILSRNCRLSRFHMSRLFKSITSYSPHQYIIHKRLSYAMSLLQESSQSIMDISYASGFNSLEHFSNSFKKKYKISPKQYRQQVGVKSLRESEWSGELLQ